MSDVTQHRLDRNEGILRDHEMHEASCPVRAAQKAKSTTPPKKAPACTCWLSERR